MSSGLAITAAAVVFVAVASRIPALAGTGVSAIVANENTHAAGRLQGGTRTVDLDIVRGRWFPDGPAGKSAIVSAFAERGKAPQIPGPLLRVAVGTDFRLRIRNTLERPIAVHDLVDLPSTSDRSIEIASGATRIVRLHTFAAGTFHYWAAAPSTKLEDRWSDDAMLSGGIVVDPPGIVPPDHIFVLSAWVGAKDAKGELAFDYSIDSINGRAWPATERLTYEQGAHVAWRIINASGEPHPMHLHGFAFDVVARGDGVNTAAVADEREVTERLGSGSTADIRWNASRAGAWMFHCHIIYHTAKHDPHALDFAGKTVEPLTFESVYRPMHADAMAMEPMGGGMIVGVTIRSHDAAARQARAIAPKRRLRIIVDSTAPAVMTAGAEMYPTFNYTVVDPSGPVIANGVGAPAIVLTRGVPVAITVVNKLDEATAVHWHGIDVQDSYFDGSGLADPWGRPVPMVMPGASFEARFTPPRAGTFMYHAHMDDTWQIPAGLAGPLIVLAPGERFDAATDHIVMVTDPRDANSNKVNVNGTLDAAPIAMLSGARQRLRILNMTALRTEMIARLTSPLAVALPAWSLIAQDGIDVARPRTMQSDVGVQVSVGQTRDVLFVAPAPGSYVLQIQTRFGGRALAKIPIVVRPTEQIQTGSR